MKYFIFISIFIFGCATIFQRGPDEVPIKSTPDGAKVYLDGEYKGETPLVLEIGRKSEGVVLIEKEGYGRIIINRDKVVAGMFFGNLLLADFLVIGMPIDLIFHNQGKYSTDPIVVVLPREGMFEYQIQGK